MKPTKVFWIALAVMIVLFITPTLMTYNDIAFDGTRVYGFPLKFYSEGGFCPPPGCLHTFSILYLAIDLLTIVLVPMLAQLAMMKMKKQNTQKKQKS